MNIPSRTPAETQHKYFA